MALSRSGLMRRPTGMLMRGPINSSLLYRLFLKLLAWPDQSELPSAVSKQRGRHHEEAIACAERPAAWVQGRFPPLWSVLNGIFLLM